MQATQEQAHADGSVGDGRGKGGLVQQCCGRPRHGRRVKELTDKLQTIKDDMTTRWKIEQRRDYAGISEPTMETEYESLAGLEKILEADA